MTTKRDCCASKVSNSPLCYDFFLHPADDRIIAHTSLNWGFVEFYNCPSSLLFIVSKFGSECRDSFAFSPAEKIMELPPTRWRQATVHWTVALNGSNLPTQKKKAETVNTVSAFLVRVSRFELEASWTPFKRDTKLRHTRICLRFP